MIGSQLARILADNLTDTVEKFNMGFECDLVSFEYFTNHCKANLVVWLARSLRSTSKDYFTCIENFNKKHNSLKLLGVNVYNILDDLNLRIVESLKKQGTTIGIMNELHEMIN